MASLQAARPDPGDDIGEEAGAVDGPLNSMSSEAKPSEREADLDEAMALILGYARAFSAGACPCSKDAG